MTLPGPPLDPLGVQITGREIYDAVIRLTGRVDVLIEQQTAVRADLQDHEQRLRVVEETRPGTRLTDLEARVRTVEARQWPLPALAIVVSALALAVTVVPKMVGGG